MRTALRALRYCRKPIPTIKSASLISSEGKWNAIAKQVKNVW